MKKENKKSIGKQTRSIRPRIKVWLETDDGYVLGEGRLALLGAIEKTNSLNRAATDLGMSYRAAWGHLRTMERRLGFALIITERGGSGGGGTRLTPKALKLVRSFESYSSDVHAIAEKQYPSELKSL